MAKKATKKSGGGAKAMTERRGGDRRSGDRRSTDRRGGSGARAKSGASEAFVALLQSPLVAELVAAAATAALTALAQQGAGGKRNAVKKAGKAAADAVKRRLTDELDEIKKAAKAAKGGAKG